MKKLTLTIAILMTLVISSGYATTWYVDGTDGDDANSGDSWPTAKATIQAGIDVASDGDTVLVKYGTYNITSSIDYGGKDIKLASDDGTHSSYEDAATDASQCIVDAGGNCGVFYFHNGETLDSVVDGFTIQNGSVSDSPLGGGISCNNSSPVITNNIIEGNYGYWGGGIACNYSSSTIANNIITANSASWGGGIDCLDSSSPLITNNIITKNSGTNGGGIHCDSSSPMIINNTITENSSRAIFAMFASSPMVLNTILWADGPQEIYLDRGSSITVTYSDVQDGWEGEGNIDADPLFVDPENDDYHLQAASPCIDAGTPIGAPPTDKDGNPRDEFPDMGAYEYQGVGVSSVTIISPADGDEFPVGAVVDVVAEVRDELGEPMEGMEVAFTATGGFVDPTTAVTDENGQAVSQLTVAEGENTVTATLTDYPDLSDTVTVIGVSTGSIKGHVIDIAGEPLRALVIAVNTETKEKAKAVTDVDGYYETPDLEPGLYWVLCIKRGYKLGIRKVEVVAGEETTVNFRLRRKSE